MISFIDKIVVLTGHSRGIGKRIKEDLEKSGAIVKGFSSKDFDLTNKKQIEDLSSLLRSLEKIDVCINNAGIIYSCEIGEHPDTRDKYEKLMNINLVAPFEISSACSEVMKKNNYGRIVNISSIAGTRVRDGRSAYSASKHALIGLTKNLSVDLGKYGILANTVSPGFTMTEMTESMLPKKEMESLCKQVPLKRFGTTEDISNAVVFLASEFNTYITGQDLIVDGGFTNAVTV